MERNAHLSGIAQLLGALWLETKVTEVYIDWPEAEFKGQEWIMRWELIGAFFGRGRRGCEQG